MADVQTILCIEDDPASRQLVQRALIHAGYNVLVAQRGLEGIDLARNNLPDLILTDINLPDMSGHEVTTALRSDTRFSDTPIVALTAQGTAHKDIAIAAGITGYLTKPFHVQELLDNLRYYLSGGKDTIDTERISKAQTEYTRSVVKRLESRIRQLEDANASLQKLDRMKETFIQITAHELRTPLTLIFGYSRLLEDYPPLRSMMEYDEGVSTLIEGLVESITRMHDIIEEILIVSRIMTNQIDLSIAQMNLSSLVSKVITSYEDVMNERNLALFFDPDEWPTNMRGDLELIRLTISNLVGNAIKYTPNGGRIYINAKTDERQLTFSIRDTGIGIDLDEQEQIFENFHTIEDTKLHSTSKTSFGGGGLGLGLPVSKGIIEAHGGTISVNSPRRDIEACPGSQFNVMLPLNPRLKDRVNGSTQS